MRIVKMDPQEKRLSLMNGPALQPIERFVHHHVAAPFRQVEVGFVQAIEIKVVEIGFKTLVETETRVEYSRTNERRRLVSILGKHRGQRRDVGGELVAAEIMHTCRHGIASCEYRGMSGQGDGDRCVGVGEARGGEGQLVD